MFDYEEENLNIIFFAYEIRKKTLAGKIVRHMGQQEVFFQ